MNAFAAVEPEIYAAMTDAAKVEDFLLNHLADGRWALQRLRGVQEIPMASGEVHTVIADDAAISIDAAGLLTPGTTDALTAEETGVSSVNWGIIHKIDSVFTLDLSCTDDASCPGDLVCGETSNLCEQAPLPEQPGSCSLPNTVSLFSAFGPFMIDGYTADSSTTLSQATETAETTAQCGDSSSDDYVFSVSMTTEICADEVNGCDVCIATGAFACDALSNALQGPCADGVMEQDSSLLNLFSGGASTTFNTTLRVMEGVCDGSLVACADDSYGSEKTALTVTMKPNTDYSIIVGGSGAADQGQFNLGFRLGPCP